MEPSESIRNRSSIKPLSCKGLLTSILARPVSVIIAVMAITFFFASFIPQLSFNTSIYDLVIEDLPETDTFNSFLF